MQTPAHDSDRSPTQRPWITGLALLLGVLILCTAAWAVSVVWTRTVNGSADGSDGGLDVVLAPNGDLYAVGYRSDLGQNTNIWVRKYNPSGVKLWTRTVNGPADGSDMAYGATVDGNGNLYVVGSVEVSGEGDNIWIRKYSSSGIKRWTRTVDGPASDDDAAYGAAVDAAGNLCVVGSVTVPGEKTNIWIRKYNSAGAKLWTRAVDGPASDNDAAYDAALDGNGHLYVVGRTAADIWIRKYDSAGAKLWGRVIDGPVSGSDSAYGAAIDGSGNLLVVGSLILDSPLSEIWIRKYSPSGAKLWTRIGARTAYQAVGRDVSVDENGAAYVIGSVATDSDSISSWIRKYSPNGVKRWTTTYAGPDDQALGEAIVVNATKRVYATGHVLETSQSTNIWVRKYAQ